MALISTFLCRIIVCDVHVEFVSNCDCIELVFKVFRVLYASDFAIEHLGYW